jgi:hypothetical protein
VTLRQALLDHSVGGAAWGRLRRTQLLNEYRARRERYASRAIAAELIYRESEVIASVRRRIADRGYNVRRRDIGEVHTYAFVPNLGWHNSLFPDLAELGPVSRYDYVAEQYGWDEFAKANHSAATRLHEMNERFIADLRRVHRERPVDWVFVYASGTEICPAAIRRITDEMGVPAVNMCLDDKHSWTGAWLGDHRRGQIDLAAVFDLSWTSARVACQWYLVEGGRPLYLPEGFDRTTFYPVEIAQDLLVSFIGGAYGFRRSVIRHLQRGGLEVSTFGRGWAHGEVSIEDQLRILCRSRINLGMGGIGYSEELTNVKGRDFEVPACGGGMYLTSYNADLAQHFVIGEEIVCYRTRDEMLELARYYIERADEAAAIALRGRTRCLREHRWFHRYQSVCQALGILDPANSRYA